MNPADYPGLDDVIPIFASANTVSFLRNKLARHPLVQYLSEKYSEKQIDEMLSVELSHFEQQLASATVIVLLTLALLAKCEGKPFPPKSKEAIEKSPVRWAKELVRVYGDPKPRIITEVSKVDVAPSATRRPSRQGAADGFDGFFIVAR